MTFSLLSEVWILFAVNQRKRRRTNTNNLPHTVAATQRFSSLQEEKLKLKRKELELKEAAIERDFKIREQNAQSFKIIGESLASIAKSLSK